jgi:hypothetical protein
LPATALRHGDLICAEPGTSPDEEITLIHENELCALSDAFNASAPCNLQIGSREERFTVCSRSETCTVCDEVTGDVYRVARTAIVEQLTGLEALQAELALRIEQRDAAGVTRLREELQPHAEMTAALLTKAARVQS